jgi:predicted ABC-type ATPase
MPTLYIIAGCNGAGKTTASYTILPEMLNCKEFVNADSIALGISPFQPDKVAFEAGRVMLQRIDQLINDKVNFAFETTLSTKSYKETIKKARQKGYKIMLLYFWIDSPKLAIDRIKKRVEKGGHHIPDTIVKRRYKRGLENLFSIFIPLCDYWLIIDNRQLQPFNVADGNYKVEKSIYNAEIWQRIQSSAHGK